MLHHPPHSTISIHTSKNNNTTSNNTRRIRHIHHTTKGPIRPLNISKTRIAIRRLLRTSSGRNLHPAHAAGLQRVRVRRRPKVGLEEAAIIRLGAVVAAAAVPEVGITTTTCKEATLVRLSRLVGITEAAAAADPVAERVTAEKIRTTIHQSSHTSVSSNISSLNTAEAAVAEAAEAITAGTTRIITPTTSPAIIAVLTASTTNTELREARLATTPFKIQELLTGPNCSSSNRRETAWRRPMPPTSI